MSLSSARTRALAGAIMATAMVAAGLLVSPSTTLGAVDSLTADPLLFGVVVAGLYLVRPLLAWPTTPLAAVVGYGFGAAVGLPIALLGVVVTVLPVFVAARWLSADNAAASETTPHTRDPAPENEGDRSRLLERAGDAVTLLRNGGTASGRHRLAARTDSVGYRDLCRRGQRRVNPPVRGRNGDR